MIPCAKGFEAEVREIQKGGYHDWNCALALVHKDFLINSTSVVKVDALWNKDDPTKKIFGIHPRYAYPFNVKKVSSRGDPSKEDVIHIRYDKQERTVSFKCSTFEYR